MFIRKKIVFKEINFFDLSYNDIKKNIKKGGLLVIPSGPGLSPLDKDQQYDFLYRAVRKKKRFSKWHT